MRGDPAGPVASATLFAVSAANSSLLAMEHLVSVDAPPAMDWSEGRPAGLAQQLWAESRPTAATLAQLALPEGSVTHGLDGQLLGWTSSPDANCDLGELWLACARQFPHTGLWPICDTAFPLKPGRGWHLLEETDGRSHWSNPYEMPSDVYDAANTADRGDYFDYFDDEPDFFREMMQECGLKETDMTLADASVFPEDPLGLLTVPDAPKSLTLVACRRPADAVLLLDFGVANDDATPGIFAGVLRSWETRFGVVPVMLHPAWTAFQVLAPPTDQTQIERLASEVFSFATDSAGQGGFHHAYGGPSVSEQELVRSREWLIWWD